jgi:hypothetical protein
MLESELLKEYLNTLQRKGLRDIANIYQAARFQISKPAFLQFTAVRTSKCDVGRNVGGLLRSTTVMSSRDTNCDMPGWSGYSRNYGANGLGLSLTEVRPYLFLQLLVYGTAVSSKR